MLMKKGELTGVTSGFKDLDAMTFGFQRQEMIVIAARPSMGKTSFALNIAEAAALPKAGKEPVATLIFSLEMSSSQLALRMLCARSRVNMKLLRDGLVGRDGREVNALGQAAEEFKKCPILIDDSSALTIMEMRAKARRIYSRKSDRRGARFSFSDERLSWLRTRTVTSSSFAIAFNPRETSATCCSRGARESVPLQSCK